MQTARILCLVLSVLLATAGPAVATNNYCAPPAPPDKPKPQDPPCPACEPKKCAKCAKSPVHVSSGTYVWDETDLSIRTTAFGINVSRYYDSSRVFDGPFGIGWSSSVVPRLHYATYAVSATVNQYVASIVMPHGALYEFTRTSSTGAFNPPIGRMDTLIQQADGSYTLTLEHSRTRFRFGAGGGMTAMVDQYGNSILYEYDTNGRVQRIVDGAGSNRAVNVTWNTATGRVASVTDSAGRSVRYTYDSEGRLEGVADAITPAGEQSRRYTYVTGRFAAVLATVRDRWNRLITKVEWDDAGRVKSYTEGDFNDADPDASTGEKYQYEYVPTGDATSAFKPYTKKKRVRSTYVGENRYEYAPLTGVVTNSNSPQTVQYDDEGRVVARFTDTGTKIGHRYDGFGRLTYEDYYNSSNQVEYYWNYTYDPVFPDKISTAKSSRFWEWQGTRNEYYAEGSVAPGALKKVFTIRTDGTTEDKVAEFVVDSRGRVTAQNGPAGSPTDYFEFNAAGDLITITRGPAVHYEYDALGRMIKSTDPAGHATTYTYDAADRLLSVTRPKPSSSSTLNFTTTYTYDQYDAASGLVFSHSTDPNAGVTKNGYDALGHLVKTIDPLGNTTTYAYRHNLLESVSDANDNVTSYAYFADGQLLSTTFPDGQIEQYTYTRNGRTASRTDRRGVTENRNYDSRGRLVSVTYSDQPGKSLDFSYEGQKLASITDARQNPVIAHHFTYDAMFRVQRETWGNEIASPPVPTQTLTYAYRYDANPLLKSYTVANVAGGVRSSTVYYNYDAFERVQKVSFDEFSADVDISYDVRGMYDKITFGNGMVRDFTYDDQGRLTKIANTHPTLGNIATFEYGYDRDWATGGSYTRLGQRVQMITTADPNTNLIVGTTKYTYDALGQLVQVDEPSGGWKKWTYDAIGNRITSQTNVSGVNPINYYKFGGNPKNSSRMLPWTYDANGNRISSGEVWDLANRLVSQGGTSSLYDWANRRTKYGNASYVYHGLDIVRERDTTAGVLNDYLFGPGLDEPLVRLDASGTKHYYASDALGSIVATLSGNTIAHNGRYDAWGVWTGGPSTFTFNGRERAAGGLYYYRARYYDPSYGRFTSEDPIEPSQARRNSVASPFLPPDLHDVMPGRTNLYAYANNSPVLYKDPLGLEGCIVFSLWNVGGYYPNPWGKKGNMTKGCTYSGYCAGAVVTYVDDDVPPGCPCDAFCIGKVNSVGTPTSKFYCFPLPFLTFSSGPPGGGIV